MYSRTHARTHNRATSQGNEKKTDKNPTKQNTEPFFAFKGYVSILLQTFLAIQLRFTTQYPFHPLRFPHTIDLRVYQAWFRLDHRSKDSSMISLFNFVCSCPFVTNELLRWRGLYRCAVCAVYLPSLRWRAFNNFRRDRLFVRRWTFPWEGDRFVIVRFSWNFESI